MTVDTLCFKTDDDFNSFVKKHPKLIVQLSADWCGPCKKISPKFHELSDKFKTIKCIKIDCTDEVPSFIDCNSLPTFKFYYQGNEDLSKLVKGGSKESEVKLEKRMSEF